MLFFFLSFFYAVGNLHSASAANLATLQSYRPLLSDYGPPSLGFSQVNMMLLLTLSLKIPQHKSQIILAEVCWTRVMFFCFRRGPLAAKCLRTNMQNCWPSLRRLGRRSGPHMLEVRARWRDWREVKPSTVCNAAAGWVAHLKCPFFKGIIHARGLVRECLAETERNARS